MTNCSTYHFPLFDETLHHIELCRRVISQIQYSEICQNLSTVYKVYLLHVPGEGDQVPEVVIEELPGGLQQG